ncbi:MAG: gliding-motility protein MglA [Deltaproteobacteria bacterium HGW-Deltaproteobacteria-22]|jgi:hypothetical protein|nr:MAG: gliding-motility protein MglA [Deltaproteobacteria bacterium HGW-Deltaproteobacteria-22]
MAYINYDNKEIAFKIVYFGPGMSGKTTNLLHVHKALTGHTRSEMVVLDTEEERTLFFDFIPLELGMVEGFALRFNLYTVPGQIHYEATRQLILEGADGVVFVADSRPTEGERNLESFRLMINNLLYYREDPTDFPLVLQYNKRDCERPISTNSIQNELKTGPITCTEAVATRGLGVMETLRDVSRMTVRRFQL